MPCLVCGDPDTVKSHLTPRAFIHDIRGGDTRAYEGSIGYEGTRFTQGGAFDRTILCHRHEDHLKDCDDYAITWLRNVDAAAQTSACGNYLSVANSRPDLLAKFVCSHVWRHAVSPQNRSFDMTLGPWEWQLRDKIFAAGRYDPSFLIIRQRWMSQGTELKELIIAPYKIDKRLWEFNLGGLRWILKLDDRRKYRSIDRVRANDKQQLEIPILEDTEFTKRPGILDIAVNMFRQDYRREMAGE